MTQFKCFTEELSLDLELTVNRWRNLPHIPLFLSSLAYHEHSRALLRFLGYATWHLSEAFSAVASGVLGRKRVEGRGG
jgi:hypothetical protein